MKAPYIFYLLGILVITSCKKSSPVVKENNKETRIFNNVLILGNSITRASPEESIGWNNNWGMAATKAEYDYVHLLTAKLRANNSRVIVNTIPTGEFELGYSNFDFDYYYSDVRKLKPDLLILRFGENIIQDAPEVSMFDARYRELISYFTKDNPDVKILAVGSFWGNPVADKSMAKYSRFVSLRPLLNDISNQAFGIFPNHSVAIHPSDKGMALICDIIWEGLDGL
jgi:hypothetical protein